MGVTFKMEMEFLTPCFLGGAEPAQQSEFRLGALKSLMRYWWRQFQDQRDTNALFDKEKRIFGYTKKRASFFLYELDRSQLKLDTSGRAYNPSRNSGQSYLFYSCIQRGQQNQPGRSKWITRDSNKNSKVKFALHFRETDPDLMRQVLLALWLFQTFGGLGTRSRRGAGSFQIEVTDSSEDMKESVKKLFKSTTEDLVQAIQREGDDWFSPIHKASPIYKALTTKSHFHRFGPKASAADVLDEIGKAMKDFRICFTYNRHNKSPLHQQAAALHSAGKFKTTYAGPDPIEKTAFGLPIICNFKQRDSSRRLIRNSQGHPMPENWKITLKPDSHERRASPLFISVKKDLSTSQYYANLLILWDTFLPSGEKIAIKYSAGGTLGNVAAPTSAALEDFLRSLP